jgi:hypothetical protein
MTTMPIVREAALKELLEVPDEVVAAAVVALGYPLKPTLRLARSPVGSFATVDRYGGQPFGEL